jgi:hypothetical protein
MNLLWSGLLMTLLKMILNKKFLGLDGIMFWKSIIIDLESINQINIILKYSEKELSIKISLNNGDTL